MSVQLDDVSRETIDKLRALENIATKWTQKINLVSRASAPMLWERHILDSVQIYRAAPKKFSNWVDLGSGGGFPGVVVSILAQESVPEARVTLVEGDARKCAFLRAALRETGSTATIINARIELVPPLAADVLSARALAELATLLGYAKRHMTAAGTAIFAKGASWKSEVSKAKSVWNFECAAINSTLDAEAAILNITGVSRA